MGAMSPLATTLLFGAALCWLDALVLAAWRPKKRPGPGPGFRVGLWAIRPRWLVLLGAVLVAAAVVAS